MFKDKNQAVKHPADILPKKVGETLPPQSSQMGYGIYHFCECEYFTRCKKKPIRMKTDETIRTNKQKPIKTKFELVFWNAHMLLLLSFIYISGYIQICSSLLTCCQNYTFLSQNYI